MRVGQGLGSFVNSAPVAIDRRVQCRLNDAPRKKTAFLPIGSQPRAEQIEHFLGTEVFNLFYRLSLDLLHDHRRGSLANAATFAFKPGFTDVIVLDPQFHFDDVSTKRIVVFMSMRGPRTSSAVVRIVVVVQDMFLVNFLFLGHISKSKG